MYKHTWYTYSSSVSNRVRVDYQDHQRCVETYIFKYNNNKAVAAMYWVVVEEMERSLWLYVRRVYNILGLVFRPTIVSITCVRCSYSITLCILCVSQDVQEGRTKTEIPFERSGEGWGAVTKNTCIVRSNLRVWIIEHSVREWRHTLNPVRGRANGFIRLRCAYLPKRYRCTRWRSTGYTFGLCA